MPPLIEQFPAPGPANPNAPPRRARTIPPPPDDSKSLLTLIDRFIAEQQTLAPVERFARHIEPVTAPAAEKYYRDLIPLANPAPGEQFAFVVDLDRCSGCKACVSACHSMNGLDDGELWRGVALIEGVSSNSDSSRIQHMTASCHHCVEPGCADGCPVLAYEKDPETGIVRHLDDQCIGCQYCVMKCPYDVPEFSKSRGIVRKCDMCHNRLAAGEAPSCVQACPHEAIRIEVVSKNSPRSNSPDTFVPGTADARLTFPTTRYISSRPTPALSAAIHDSSFDVPQPAHWPLVFMLVLTQAAAGMHLLVALLHAAGRTESIASFSFAAFATLIAGMAASVAHLGRPLKAWRAFLGWRKSWMSREIIVFMVYAPVAGAVVFLPGPAIAFAAAAAALSAVACSAMIYVDTHRSGWNAAVVFPKFFGTTLLLGATVGAAWAGWTTPAIAPVLATIATAIRTALFAWEWTTLIHALNQPDAPAHRSAQFMVSRLRPVLSARAILFAVSTAFSVLAIFNSGSHGAVWGTIACGTTLLSQFLERFAFFAGSRPAPPFALQRSA